MTEVKTTVFFPKLKGFFFSVPPDDGKSSITHYSACSGYKSNEFSPLKTTGQAYGNVIMREACRDLTCIKSAVGLYPI